MPLDIPVFSKELLTAVFTIIGGILILVIGQLIEKVSIIPLDKFRRTLGEVSFTMLYFANIYSSPGLSDAETQRTVSDKLRNSAAQLAADSHAIIGYSFFYWLRLVPRREHVDQAVEELFGLSNTVFHGDMAAINNKWRLEISTLLGVSIQDIVNSFERTFYLDGDSGHREHYQAV